jgi:hypothetical protein
MWLPAPAWAQTQFSYSRDPSSVVVRYVRTPGELEASGSSTVVTVYGNGRVIVEFPSFSPRPGPHETSLSTEELDSMLADLVTAGVMELDTAALQEEPAATASQSGQYSIGTIRTYTADADVVQFVINLDSYTRPGGATAENVEKRIVLRGLQNLGEQHASNAAVARLAAAERRLIALIESASPVPRP